MNFTPETILLVIAAVTGLVGMPVIDAFKKWFKWEDKPALSLAVVLSIGLGLVVSFVSGAITGDLTDVANVATAATTVFTFATVFFKAMKKTE
jgi:H+/Cl- antiporter ClcA